MEIREFAERVLFGAALEDKLSLPGKLTDDRPGAAIAAPAFPGRPPALALDAGRVRARFPARIERPRQRGEVLHFFANHELLALELMALVLLRFPAAPEAFRAGLVSTMIDEQRHMRLYLDRMETCGVALGVIPVSAFFWTCLAEVADPLRFVAGMSLTFEQANLDYSLYYQRAFAEAGDAQTAEVLQRVYEDEVRHVRHGLTWFRAWRSDGAAAALVAPTASEFEAHAALLTPPLSPSRARGLTLDRAARLKAGFTPAYIDALEVYARSKGRPPTVRWFDPGIEARVAAHPQTPSAAVRNITRDLALLPMLISAPDDIVMVPELPSQAFLLSLREAGVQTPELCTDWAALADRQLGRLEPWGWAPGSEAPGMPLEKVPDYGRWSEAFGKHWSARLLASMLAGWTEDADWLGGAATVCADERAVRAAVAACGDAWIKAPYSAAGRGRIRPGGPWERWEACERQWLERALSQWGMVVVDPHLEVVFEFSVLLSVGGPERIRRLGYGRSLVDSRGQYKGSVIGPLRQGLDRSVLRFLAGDGRDPRRLDRVGERVAEGVGEALLALGFEGLAGVDALIYRGADGQLRLRPVLEVNPRTTMGHIAAGAGRAIAPGCVGVMTVVSRRQQARAGTPPPPETSGGKLSGGVLALTEPHPARQFSALLSAGRRLSDCRAALGRGGIRVPGLDEAADRR